MGHQSMAHSLNLHELTLSFTTLALQTGHDNSLDEVALSKEEQ